MFKPLKRFRVERRTRNTHLKVCVNEIAMRSQLTTAFDVEYNARRAILPVPVKHAGEPGRGIHSWAQSVFEDPIFSGMPDARWPRGSSFGSTRDFSLPHYRETRCGGNGRSVSCPGYPA